MSKNKYAFPLSNKWIRLSLLRRLLWFVEQLVCGTHEGTLRYALDYIVPSGIPIYAAAEGVVVWVKNTSCNGGPLKKYWYAGNRVILKHRYGEYSAYEHLRYCGAVVRLKQKIKRGQLIGYSGKTGYGLFPHLHFEIFTNPTKDLAEGKTIPITFSQSQKPNRGAL